MSCGPGWRLSTISDSASTRTVRHDVHFEGDDDLGADPEPEVIRLQVEMPVHRGRWRNRTVISVSPEDYAGADVKRHAAPTPRINLRFQCGEVSTVVVLAQVLW
jgi:hypothetical protein